MGYFISGFLLGDLFFVPWQALTNVLMWPNGAVFGSETGMAEGIRGFTGVPFETGCPGILPLFCIFTGFLLVLVHTSVREDMHTYERDYAYIRMWLSYIPSQRNLSFPGFCSLIFLFCF